MDCKFFSVIVVGGGPAGSAAAYTLASKGTDVCLIDKATFPREKLCGGLITYRSKKIFERVFGRELTKELVTSSKSVSFFSGPSLLGSPENSSYDLFFTMRFDFDAHLLNLASEAGATTKLGSKLESVDFEQNELSLESGERFKFGFLIAADGVNSQVAKNLYGASFNPDTIGFGLEVEVPRSYLPAYRDSVEIDFHAARWGYGWVFPKKKTITIGVGGIHKLNPDLRDKLRDYLQLKKLDISEFKVKGQYIPFGDFRKTPGKDNILLCGDAAGTVDPITGEGIAYAMQSGAAAAEAVMSAKTNKDPTGALQCYLFEYEQISRALSQACFWRRFIFPRPLHGLFNWAFSDASTLRKGYLDILAGAYDYDALNGLFLKQAKKAFAKPFRLIWNRVIH